MQILTRYKLHHYTMKQKFLREGILLLCSVMLPSITQAANYTINVPGTHTAAYPCDWSGTEAIAVSNGVVYAVTNYSSASSSGLWYYNTGTNTGGQIATGANNNGHCIASDSNKNIVFAYGSEPNHNTQTQLTSFRVYKAKSGFGELISTADYKDLDLSSVFNAFTEYTYYFNASGNLWDGTGYLYFTNGSKAVRITVDSNGNGIAQHAIDLPSSIANTTEPNRDILTPQADGKYIIQLRSGTTAVACTVIPDCSIDWENGTISLGSTQSYYMAASKGQLQGHDIFVHPNATRNSTLDATAVKPLIVEVDNASYTIDSHPDKTGAGLGAYATVNAWTAFEKIDDNTLGLYIYSPRNNGNGCVSRYNITATELTGEMVIPATPSWSQAASGYASSNPVRFQQPAVSPNGYMYLPGGNSTNYSGTIKGIHVFGNGVSELVSSGGSALGFGGAFDDNNHYVFHGAYSEGQESYDVAPTTLRVKQPCGDNAGSNQPYTLMGTMENNATFATLNLGDFAPGIIAKYFDATGDMATEGYVWWIPNETYSDQKLKLHGVMVSNWAPSEKITIDLASLYGLKTSTTGNNFIQFYDTSDKTRNRALLQLHGNGLYDVVINLEDRVSVSSTRIPDSSAANYMNTGAHIFMLNGHKMLARSVETSGVGSTSNPTKFEIVDITDINNIRTIAVIQPTYGNNVNGASNIGTWLQSRKINDKTVELWAYGAGCGVEVYTITANITDAASITLTGRIDVNKAEQDNRQDAVLTWTSPAGYDVEEYKIYCTEEYTSTYNGNTLDKTYFVGSTTANTITHQNLHWIKGSRDWYKQSYTYTVYPVLADGSIGPNATITLTPDFLPCPPVWDKILTYDGYQKAQLYWTTPSWGQAPNYYNVYRDGVKINEAPILNYNFLDTQIPSGEHTYYIEGFYLEDSSDVTTSTLTNRNEDRTALIAPRDPMKATYSIETIYNYRIGSGSGEVNPQGVYSTLTNNLRYKQGEYYRGHWYLMQQNNNTTDYSRILRFNADKSKILTETATPVVSYSIAGSSTHYSTAGWSVGMAMDDAGNIFIRRGGIDSNGNYTTSSRIRYYFELGAGDIYLRNSDGSYSSTPITVDLSKCQLFDFDTQYNLFEPINNIYYGRTEYFNMTGDLSEVGGTAYLWVSASGSKRSNKIQLTRTASGITATLVEKVDLTLTHSLTGEDFAVGVENYVFPVKYLKKNADGSSEETYRGDYIHNLRSRAYANIKPNDNPADNSDTQATIFDTQSRVNQCGGTTIGWNNEIFLITPQCPYSQNSGNFYVSMGDRAQYDSNGNLVIDESTQKAVMLDAESADLTKPIPVAQLTQTEITDGSFSNSNGNWIYAALGKVENEEEIGVTEGFTDPNDATCVYIYQYIPGVRFAKYRLIPNNYFPGTPVDLTINNMHEDTEYTDGDLVRYDGTAQFGIALETSVTTTGNVNYEIDYYTYTFKDAAGTDVWTYTVSPDGSYTYTRVKDGETTTGSGTGALVNESYTDINGNVHSAYFTFEHSDLKRDTNYQSTVTVNYVNTVDDTDTHQSETTVDEDKRNYTPEPPVKESVTVFKGEDGSSVDGIYRVEVNFDQPATTPEEPVSYYEIIVTKPVVDANGNQIKDAEGNPVSVTDTITGFDLLVGGVPENTGKDYVPGNYDFDSNEGQYAEGGTSTVIFYYTVPETTPDDNASTDPMDWTYTVSAVYGGSNPNISTEASVDMSPSNGGTTAIENIGNSNGKLNVYPVPAQTVITVKAAEAIETVTLYSLTGTAVMEFAGNSDTTMTVDISALASGYYFLEVNRNPVVRVLKK